MKKMLLPFSLSLLAWNAQAQHQSIARASFGLKAGANYSGFRLKNFTAGSRGDSKFGAAAGAFIDFPITTILSIQPELMYNNTGGDIRFEDPLPIIFKQELSYLSMPLQARVQLSRHLSLLAGPQFDFLMNAKSVIGGESTPNKNEVRKSDIALTGGIEIAPVKSLIVTAKYAHGLQNVPRDEANGGLYNTYVQLTIGYRMFCKKQGSQKKMVATAFVDTDKDGIGDDSDNCPLIAGTTKYNGCPIPDKDHDGVNDDEDNCPDIAGTTTGHGCPIIDTDHDGVNDQQDKCPDIAGTIAYQGCPVHDRDNDGVSDVDDRCPDIAGTLASSGCPDLKTNRFDASAIQFLSGSTTLTTEAQQSLAKGAEILNSGSFRTLNIIISGYTDNTGKQATNRFLSQQRANAVKAYLISKGIASNRMQSIGYGSEKPIADNSTLDGRSRNRRVEFEVRQ